MQTQTGDNTLRWNLHFYENFHVIADCAVQKEYSHFVSDKDCLYRSLAGVFIRTDDVECDGAFVRRFMNVESQESNRNCCLAHVQPTVSLRWSLMLFWIFPYLSWWKGFVEIGRR